MKMVDNDKWMKINNKQIDLPRKYDHRYKLEAIDASGLPLMYESFGNFGKYCYINVFIILIHFIVQREKSYS